MRSIASVDNYIRCHVYISPLITLALQLYYSVDGTEFARHLCRYFIFVVCLLITGRRSILYLFVLFSPTRPYSRLILQVHVTTQTSYILILLNLMLAFVFKSNDSCIPIEYCTLLALYNY